MFKLDDYWKQSCFVFIKTHENKLNCFRFEFIDDSYKIKLRTYSFGIVI